MSGGQNTRSLSYSTNGNEYLPPFLLHFAKKEEDATASSSQAVEKVPQGTFSTACIPLLSRPSWGGKVLALLAVALARQGLQGMSSHSRRAAAPSSSPAETERTSHATEVFRQAEGPPLMRRALPVSVYSCVLKSRQRTAPAAPAAPPPWPWTAPSPAGNGSSPPTAPRDSPPADAQRLLKCLKSEVVCMQVGQIQAAQSLLKGLQ